LELRDAFGRTRSGWIEDFHDVPLVRHHENISIRAIRGAQTAANAVIFDHDLEMFAAMNRIDRTTRHAVWIGAGATRNRDEIIAEAATVAQQTCDRHAVRFVAMLTDATFGAFVATRAQIHVEHENALAFIKTLLNVLGHDRIDFAVAAERAK